jgi:5'-nucleotidase
MGGVAARAALINQIRSEGGEVLLLDAGDLFQGTPYFNVFKGEPEIKAMSAMRYDACTMGNHDFDAGLDNFLVQMQKASFPLIIANYNFTNTIMEGKTMPYKIFRKGGLKVGVLGVGIELRGLVPEALYGNTVYMEPVQRANEVAAQLRKEGCDLVICLSHLGDRYQDDKVSDEILAKESYDIDLIIGGHTHRFFEAPRRYFNRRGNECYVNQVGWGGIQLGRIDYIFEGGRSGQIAQAKSVTIGKLEGQ